MLFRAPSLTKTRRSGRPREVLYPKFVLDDRISPVSIPSLYLKLSQNHCIQLDEKQPLFVAVKIPHKAVTAATTSRWLKEILCRAGVDMNIFKAHSTRTVSTSAAKARGVSIVDVMKAANCTRESTFTRFYYKPVNLRMFGTTILDKVIIL